MGYKSFADMPTKLAVGLLVEGIDSDFYQADPILDPAIRPIAERFLVAISTMVVTGAVLRQALNA